MSDTREQLWMEGARAEIEGWLQAWGESVAGPPPLREAMRYSLQAGGKRLRPLLCLAAAEAVGVSARLEVLVDLAIALELTHTYSLIHDDLPAMDDDDLRRGKPTSHKVFGEALAILAGDGLLTEAFGCLAREASATRAALVCVLASAAGSGGMVGGQVLDVARGAAEGGLAAVEEAHRLKTAALIQAACVGGGRAVEASETDLAALATFGESVGLAFQIVDDLLDQDGDAEAMGKAVGKDAARGCVTVPGVIGSAAARDRARALLATAREALASLPGNRAPLLFLAARLVERVQ